MSDEMRICTHPKCQHAGAPQSVENFPIRKDRGGRPSSWCWDCHKQAKRDYMNRRRANDSSSLVSTLVST